MKKNIILILLFLISSACSMPSYTPTTIKELLPVGSIMQLTQPIEIPAGRSFVYIAGGRVAPFTNINPVNVYLPYCKLHLRHPAASDYQVKPGQFKVTKIVEWEDYHGSIDTRKFSRTTGEGGLIKVRRAAFRDDAGPSTIMYATIMSLSSPTQPEVKELVCGHQDDQGIVEPLTLKEMKSALGNLIRVEIKPRGAI